MNLLNLSKVRLGTVASWPRWLRPRLHPARATPRVEQAVVVGEAPLAAAEGTGPASGTAPAEAIEADPGTAVPASTAAASQEAGTREAGTQEEQDYSAIYGDEYNPVADPTLPPGVQMPVSYDPWEKFKPQLHPSTTRWTVPSPAPWHAPTSRWYRARCVWA